MRGVSRALERDVDLARAVVVVEDDRVGHLVVAPDRVPQERAVDDGELEALAAVDRQDLHGVGVGLQPPGALLVATFLDGGADPGAQPARQRGGAEALVDRGAVQELADVAQVGHAPLAVDVLQDTLGQPLGRGDDLQQRGDAAGTQDARPAVQAAVD